MGQLKQFSNKTRTTQTTAGRMMNYLLRRTIRLTVCVVFSIFLVIILTNIGVIRVSDAGIESFTRGWFAGYRSPVERSSEAIREALGDMYLGAEGFWEKNFVLLYRGLTFDFEESMFIGLFTDMQRTFEINQIIPETLARTLLVFGISNLLLFVITIGIALRLSQKPGGFLDRLISYLSPLSSIPIWVIGFFLTILLLRWFKFYAGGLWEDWPNQWTWAEIVSVLKYTLPLALAIIIGKLFQGIYLWRSFFLIHAEEDYIHLGKAKGLPQKVIFRNYIMRPALTPLMVRLSVIVVGIWQEALILEVFYKIVGVGRILFEALRSSDFPLIVSMVTVFGILIGSSILITDVICAIFDPRLKADGRNQTNVTIPRARSWRLRMRPRPAAQSRMQRIGRQTVWQKLSNLVKNVPPTLKEWAASWRRLRKSIKRSPSAIAGLLMMAFLLGISLLSFSDAPFMNPEDPELINPALGSPAWVNAFRINKLPESSFWSSQDGSAQKLVGPGPSEGSSKITIVFEFDYRYDRVPQDLILHLDPQFQEKSLMVTLTWFTPDGREIEIDSFTISRMGEQTLNLPQAKGSRVNPTDKGIDPLIHLFCPPEETRQTVRGSYRLEVETIVFEEQADIHAKLRLIGQVYGLAGTDGGGYDMVPWLLRGAPYGLFYGVLAAVFTVVFTIIIGAVSAWFGSTVDSVIQWVAEVVMITPLYPVLMLLALYTKISVVMILFVAVVMTVFGASVKTYHSIFVNIKQEAYIEAGIAYGAGNFRLIMKYLLPRIITLAIPEIVLLVPSFVFLQTTLTFLGIATDYRFTWSWLIYLAYISGRLGASAHTVLAPMILMLTMALAFVLIGRFFEGYLKNGVEG